MGYFIRADFDLAQAGPLPEGPPVAQAKEDLLHGSLAQRRAALERLIAAHAEADLVDCLRAGDDIVSQLAASGLWECWLNEAGPDARKEMDHAIDVMSGGDFVRAAEAFEDLVRKYPGWTEANNKLATVLYLQGKAAESMALCERVVARKPDHFGAWNGLALCAVQVEDWPAALRAVRQSLRLQPQSPYNQQLLRLIESRLPSA